MRKFVVAFIKNIDKFIVKLCGWSHIPNSSSNFIYLNPYKYNGKTIILKDGTLISKGDIIAEIHIDNANIKILDTSYGNLKRLLKGELLALKISFQEEPYSKIKAVYGISVFYNIASRQGFTISDIDNIFKKLFISVWENILRWVFKNEHKKGKKKFLISKECWLSRDQILLMK